MTVTVNRAKSSRSRRRDRKGAAHAAPGGGRGAKGPLLAGLVALAVISAAGFAVAAWSPPDAERTPAAAGSGEREGPTAGEGRAPEPSAPAPRPTGAHSATAGHSASARPPGPAAPRKGPGTFVTASGQSAKVGHGRTLRYRVEVENGIALSAADTAKEVERVLSDPRGWTADGHSAFQRVSTGPTDFVVKVATPGTVDAVCAQYGLDTHGDLNCSVSHNVMVNLTRWEQATPVYAKDVTGYRALIINHEVGHFLGHGHVTCPGRGRPAPAMMQQIKGMHGCVPNVWPYDAQGRLITGPAAP